MPTFESVLLTNEGGTAHKYVDVPSSSTDDGSYKTQHLTSDEEPSSTEDVAKSAHEKDSNSASKSFDYGY